MNRYIIPVLSLCIIAVLSCQGCSDSPSPALSSEYDDNTVIELPEPVFDGGMSLEQAIHERRSVREYSGEPVTVEEISRLLWAAQGITNPQGLRTAPSAGGLYPLEIYVAAGNMTGLEPGVYRYRPVSHDIVTVHTGDIMRALAAAALDQEWIAKGAVSLVITAVYERTTEKYGERGIRYVHMEAGHAAQNVCLQAIALNLGTVTIGAFDDDRVAELLGMPDNEEPLYVLPVGKP